MKYLHEVGLVGAAAVHAPKSFQVDSADVAATGSSSEDSVDLQERAGGLSEAVHVAASVLADPFLACHILD